ncbi:MAG: hypothetical protein E7037_08270 [Verrucomicrobia bacterium]|nr:hypothetical protein [Verrucomicrobiota bacterium]
MEEWKSGRVEKWKSGRVEKWKSGKVEEWKSGRVEKKVFLRRGVFQRGRMRGATWGERRRKLPQRRRRARNAGTLKRGGAGT